MRTHPPQSLSTSQWWRGVDYFKYLEVNIHKDMTWASHTTPVPSSAEP